MQTYFINLYKRGKDIVQGDGIFTTDDAAYCEVLETHGSDYEYTGTTATNGANVHFSIHDIEMDQQLADDEAGSFSRHDHSGMYYQYARKD